MYYKLISLTLAKIKLVISDKYFIMTAITVYSLLLYIYRLNSLPYQVHTDEGATAMQALSILDRKTGIIGIGWFDLPLLSFLPHALTMFIFGDTIFGNRFGSVIFGILTLPLFYLLVNELFNKRVAITASILLANSHIWIALSRLGISFVQATFLGVAAFYLCLIACRKLSYRYFVFGGVLLGLCFYSYYAGRIMPFIIIPYVFYYLIYISKQPFVKVAKYVSVLVVSALITFSPQAIFYLDNPKNFTSRQKTVYIYSDMGQRWQELAYNIRGDEILPFQIRRSFDIFSGDNSFQYRYKGQLFDYISIALFLTGLIAVFIRYRPKALLLFLWLLLPFVTGQILTTIPAPISVQRYVVGLPVIYIFCALGLELFFRIFYRKKLYIYIFSVIAIIFIMFYNIKIYFIDYPRQIADNTINDYHSATPRKISEFINSLDPNYVVYYLTHPDPYAESDTIKFLTLQNPIPSFDLPKNYDFSTNFPDAQDQKAVYIFYPEFSVQVSNLMKLFPEGMLTKITNQYGALEIYIYKIN